MSPYREAYWSGEVCFHGRLEAMVSETCVSQILFKRKRVGPKCHKKVFEKSILGHCLQNIISSSKRGSTSMIPIKWMFPKIGGKPPKWMVKIMEKPYWNGWFRGFQTPYFLETSKSCSTSMIQIDPRISPASWCHGICGTTWVGNFQQKFGMHKVPTVAGWTT